MQVSFSCVMRGFSSPVLDLVLTICSSFAFIRVRVQRLDDVLEVCPTILTEDGMQAQHLGATLALYNLVKGQVTHAQDATAAVFLHDTLFFA